MYMMRSRVLPGLLVMLVTVISGGCARYATVEYPPVIELRSMVGIITFDVLEGDPARADDATHRFIASLQRAQPGTLVLELGTKTEVLKRVGAHELDPAAFEAIGKIAGVDAVLSGSVRMKSPRPQVDVAGLTRIRTMVNIDASMKAAIHETRKGAMLWTNGASGSWNLGGVDATGKIITGGMADPARKHTEIVAELVRVTTRDLHPSFVRRRVN
jgi:hypothetical protein